MPTGESVYTQGDFVDRAGLPLYCAARELVEIHSRTGVVLDIGCSDGPATYGLREAGIEVYGMDMSHQALEAARESTPGYMGFVCDMRRLPPDDFFKTSDVDTVLMLDVLEHENREDSLKVLRSLRDKLTPAHTLIVCMPIISPLSRCTWREAAQWQRSGERPETGLFDRTHQILTGQRGHMRLFTGAGYRVEERYQTNDVDHLTGTWDFMTRSAGAVATGPSVEAEVDNPLARIGGVITRSFTHPSEEITAIYHKAHLQGGRLAFLKGVSERLVAFQGLYVLKPDYRQPRWYF